MGKILFLVAHPGDFVWRAAGTIAKHVKQGHDVRILSLTTGARGESPKLWTGPDVTIDVVRAKRMKEAHDVAALLGAPLKILPYEDFPFDPPNEIYGQVAEVMRESNPDVIVTHAPHDPSNFDHVIGYQVSVRARMMVTSPGRGLNTIKSPKIICFEPHFPEHSGFLPNLFIDITEEFEVKKKAIAMTPSQSNLWDYYLRLAQQRGTHAGVLFAEAFQRLDPDVRQSIF